MAYRSKQPKSFFLLQKFFWTSKIFQFFFLMSRNCPVELETSRNCPAALENVQKLSRRVRKRPETAPRRVRNVKKLPRRVRPSSQNNLREVEGQVHIQYRKIKKKSKNLSSPETSKKSISGGVPKLRRGGACMVQRSKQPFLNIL